MFKITQYIFMGVLFFLTTSQVLYASSKLTVDEMKKLALKKSETQKIVEEMLNHNQAGCGKELEKNEYAAKLDKIPIQDRQFQEIISTYKKGRYNLCFGDYVSPRCPLFNDNTSWATGKKNSKKWPYPDRIRLINRLLMN